MPDRAFLVRHALGQLAINEVYRTSAGVCVVRSENTVYSISVRQQHFRKFRTGRRITDESLWELTALVLQCETLPEMAENIVS
jgi:hypothetical protein